jgi:hypothetical protein
MNPNTGLIKGALGLQDGVGHVLFIGFIDIFLWKSMGRGSGRDYSRICI